MPFQESFGDFFIACIMVLVISQSKCEIRVLPKMMKEKFTQYRRPDAACLLTLARAKNRQLDVFICFFFPVFCLFVSYVRQNDISSSMISSMST